MGTPAIFLDRDGTLIEDAGHLGDPAQVAFYPETFDALRRLGGQFLLFIVTNQSGIAKGVTTADGVRRVNDFVVRRLAEERVAIREVYCCPHQRSDGCACIKPNPHFVRKAAADHGVDVARSFVVGDHPADVELAANTGARGIFVLSGHGENHRADLKAPCEIVAGISEAVDRIARARAVETLRAGGLVAFPTETVYGLGADASNEGAVRRIFGVKGRPTTHPLIVHAADPWPWAMESPAEAARLADRFWPGPLTMILKRAPQVGDYVTGGQDTVGLRVPSHPVARELLEQFGGGVAAPSANVFGRVSPTSAAHVREDLGAEADCVLEGGSSEVGIESTIVDLSGAAPALLRPGHVRAEQLEAVLGCRLGAKAAVSPRHPGGLERHYAPRTPAILVAPHALDARIAQLGARVAVLAFSRPDEPVACWVRMPREPAAYAQRLYSALREMDAARSETILIESPPESPDWAAVLDRLRRAAGSG